MKEIGRESSVYKSKSAHENKSWNSFQVLTSDPGRLRSSTLVLRGCITSLFLSLPLTGSPWLNSISRCLVSSSSSNSLSSILGFFSAVEALEVLLVGASTTSSLLLLEANGTSPCGGPNLPGRGRNRNNVDSEGSFTFHSAAPHWYCVTDIHQLKMVQQLSSERLRSSSVLT